MSDDKRIRFSYVGKKIFKALDYNPFRTGSKREALYNAIPADGLTYEQFVELGGTTLALRFGWDRGYVVVKDEEGNVVENPHQDKFDKAQAAKAEEPDGQAEAA